MKAPHLTRPRAKVKHEPKMLNLVDEFWNFSREDKERLSARFKGRDYLLEQVGLREVKVSDDICFILLGDFYAAVGSDSSISDCVRAIYHGLLLSEDEKAKLLLANFEAKAAKWL